MKKVVKKEPIRLRAKLLKNGNKSLYLDCINNGFRSYEFLKLYIIPEKTAWDKERNRTTMIQAESHKARRIIELQQGKYGVVQNGFANRIKMVAYIERMLEDEKLSLAKSSRKSYRQAQKIVSEFGDIDVQKVDVAWCKGLLSYINKRKGRFGIPSESTRHIRYKCINAALNRAVKEGIISTNPFRNIDNSDIPRERSAEREILTLQEVSTLANTLCKRGSVKRAFLFSCFCGLRYSDIASLAWGNIRETSEGVFQLQLTQAKTQMAAYIPLSANAIKWLPQRPKQAVNSDKVFPLLPTTYYINRVVKKWVEDAGITKHVTFHVARHTCATLLLTYGADLYTVSKILGHTDIHTTEVYAKVVDKKRAEAVNLIPTI